MIARHHDDTAVCGFAPCFRKYSGRIHKQRTLPGIWSSPSLLVFYGLPQHTSYKTTPLPQFTSIDHPSCTIEPKSPTQIKIIKYQHIYTLTPSRVTPLCVNAKIHTSDHASCIMHHGGRSVQYAAVATSDKVGIFCRVLP